MSQLVEAKSKEYRDALLDIVRKSADDAGVSSDERPTFYTHSLSVVSELDTFLARSVTDAILKHSLARAGLV